MQWTVEDVFTRLHRPQIRSLPAPVYQRSADSCARPALGLAVVSMKEHMTDEGWQIFNGLRHAGYELAGYGLVTYGGHEGSHTQSSMTDVGKILKWIHPRTLVLQDHREWDISSHNFRDPRARFTNVHLMRKKHDIFRLTILKDAQQQPAYHQQAAVEIGCHAWIVYYHPRIVNFVAPYTRFQHLIRTYHTIDTAFVPPLLERAGGCLLSGAVSGAYPLRKRLVDNLDKLPYTNLLKHPGYHRNGCATPDYLKILSRYRVAICTASIYGYALRKLIEATACGCRVITDLPVDEILPEIDGNLIRIHPNTPLKEIAEVIDDAIDTWDEAVQHEYSQAAMERYDYRNECERLANQIEALRAAYGEPT